MLVGDTGVGKSCILVRYIRQEYTNNTTSTMSVECFDRVVPLQGGSEVLCRFWDTGKPIRPVSPLARVAPLRYARV